MENNEARVLVSAVENLTRAVKNLNKNITEKMTENASSMKEISACVDSLERTISMRPFH